MTGNSNNSEEVVEEEEGNEFISVTHKKKSIPKKNRKGKNVVRVEKTLVEKLLSSRTSLESSGYLTSCTKQLREALTLSNEELEDEGIAVEDVRRLCPTPVCIVCLGLGNISDSSKSRDQYALLQNLILDLKDSSIRKPIIYDPVFKEEDIEYFKNDGIEVLLEEHDLKFDGPTLIYMPHCPRSLFDDMLRKNWSVEGLKDLVILGNRLDMYDDPTHSSSTSSAKAPFVVKAVPLFQILPLPVDNDHFDVFNDLALEWIPIETLLSKEPSFWDFVPKEAEEEVKGEERKKE